MNKKIWNEAKRLNESAPFKSGSESNIGGIKNLFKDLEERIWEYQAETELEKENIIIGLNYLIKKVKSNKL